MSRLDRLDRLEARVNNVEAKCNYCVVGEKFKAYLKSLKKEMEYVSGHFEVVPEKKEEKDECL